MKSHSPEKPIFEGWSPKKIEQMRKEVDTMITAHQADVAIAAKEYYGQKNAEKTAAAGATYANDKNTKTDLREGQANGHRTPAGYSLPLGPRGGHPHGQVGKLKKVS